MGRADGQVLQVPERKVNGGQGLPMGTCVLRTHDQCRHEPCEARCFEALEGLALFFAKEPLWAGSALCLQACADDFNRLAADVFGFSVRVSVVKLPAQDVLTAPAGHAQVMPAAFYRRCCQAPLTSSRLLLQAGRTRGPRWA